MSNVTMTPELEHFFDLAKKPCYSSGEHAANRLAKCVLEFVPLLDDSALTGLCEFMVIARNCPMTARDLWEEGNDDGSSL